MRYPSPLPSTHIKPFFEYDRSVAVIIRPLEEEIWAAIRLLSAQDICVGQLRRRRSSFGRRGPLKKIASKIGSCITQAEEYFWMGLEASPRAAPLLHYYSMLNLTKALIYLHAPQRLEDERGLFHGLTDSRKMKHASGFSLEHESVMVRGGVFPSLYYVLTGEEISRRITLDVFELLRYCVWISQEMAELGMRSRLIEGSFSVTKDADAKVVRLTAEIARDEVRDHCSDLATFEVEAPHFSQLFKRVASDDREMLRYESHSAPYTTNAGLRAAEKQLTRAMAGLRLYRHMMTREDNQSADYLLPLNRGAGKPLPEPCVLLALAFYLGSLVRYQPHIYDHLLGSEDAWLLEAFVRQCPLAFSHLMLNHLWRWEHIFRRP